MEIKTCAKAAKAETSALRVYFIQILDRDRKLNIVAFQDSHTVKWHILEEIDLCVSPTIHYFLFHWENNYGLD